MEALPASGFLRRARGSGAAALKSTKSGRYGAGGVKSKVPARDEQKEAWNEFSGLFTYNDFAIVEMGRKYKKIGSEDLRLKEEQNLNAGFEAQIATGKKLVICTPRDLWSPLTL